MKKRRRKKLNNLEFNIETEAEYCLLSYNYKDGDLEGNGFIVLRLSDKQKLDWRTLTRDTGLESVKVSGCSHHLEELQHDCFKPGSPIKLIHEPDNPYSKTAIGVYDHEQKYKIGYIPKEEEKRILKRLENDEIGKSIIMWENYKGDERISVRLLLIDKDKNIEPALYIIHNKV